MSGRWSLALLLAGSACGDDPSSQIVTIEVQAADVEAIRLEIRREDQVSPVVDCRIGASSDLEGRCPFEEPGQSWAPGAPLSFVLYGEPGTAVTLRADGLDGDGEVITSTAGRRVLGGEATPFVLIPRTWPRRACAIDVRQDATVAESQRDRSMLLPADLDGDGTLELVAGTPRRISVFRWSKLDPGGCALVESATVATDCTPRSASMALGEIDPRHAGLELAAVCISRSSTNKNRLMVWGLEVDRPAEVLGEDVVEGALGQISRPVLADLDGDGTSEVTYLAVTSTTGPVVSLASWRPDRMTTATVAIGGLRLSSSSASLPYAPLVERGADGRDAVYVGAYRGGLFRVAEGMSSAIESTNATPPTAFAGALIGAMGELPARALFVRDGNDGTAVLETKLVPRSRSTLRILAERQRIPGAATIAVAIGDVDGGGGPSAVLAADGFIQVVPLTSTTAPARRFPLGDTVDGAMVVLLANIDGAPGAEILAFQPKVGRVHALDGAGRVVPGFPVALGVPGPETRVVVADLDGDRAVELIALSYDRIGVLSLGPRTHDPEAAPWPQAFRDAGGRASGGDERDPTRSP